VTVPAAAEALLSARRAELRRALAAGHPVDPSALDDTEYGGISLALPAIVERLTWKTFTKTFHRDPKTGELRGWNVRMEQTGVGGPPVPRTKKGVPRTWGHYRVYPAKGVRLAAGYDNGLLIDYGVRANDFVTRRMRDPLVAVTEGDPSVLLGVSYLDLGLFRLMTPTFFVLVRRGPLTYVPP
jgi:hypothetical protein